MIFLDFLRRRRAKGDQPRRFPVQSADNCGSSQGEPVISAGQRDLPLTAFRTKEDGLRIEVASANRRWMNETTLGFANRCLPLRIASQAGWFILSHEQVEVVWDGTGSATGLTMTKGTMDEQFVSSHFGHGILTWKIPYLFRTPPGYNLYVRGPANWCKDGASPLDGIIETDWAVSTFTMNWKITRPRVPVRFEKGEPICMIFPIVRGEIERFAPEIRRLEDDPEIETQFNEWKRSRHEFNQSKRGPVYWEKHYYVGKTNRGGTFPEHQVDLKLKRFRERR